jgi:hypothetical protein
MRLPRPSTAILILFFTLLVSISVAHAQGGTLTGRISLADKNGTVTYGDWMRVFLTTEAIAIPTVDLASTKLPWERKSRINTGHMEFFVNFRKKQDQPGFTLDNKLTRPDGTFTFNRIPAGHYYVVVTFPTMIAGFKCAWQVPVDVIGGQRVHVELNNDNLAIPAY